MDDPPRMSIGEVARRGEVQPSAIRRSTGVQRRRAVVAARLMGARWSVVRHATATRRIGVLGRSNPNRRKPSGRAETVRDRERSAFRIQPGRFRGDQGLFPSLSAQQ